MIYFDNSATTPLLPDVIKAAKLSMVNAYGNPSSQYQLGNNSKQIIEDSRCVISDFLNADSNEIYFTSGGSESNSLAIIGTAIANRTSKKNHIITSSIEHDSVLNACKYLEQNGFEVTYICPMFDGRINWKYLQNAIRPETMLISIMYANNEIGTIQDIQTIGKLCKLNNIIFHVDAVQAYGHIPIDVQKDNIDMLSASAHKIGGFKGTGILYKKNGINVQKIIFGGHQEFDVRSGTENVIGIESFSVATKVRCLHLDEWNKYVNDLKLYLYNSLSTNIDGIFVNGSLINRLSGNLNILIKDMDSTQIQELLAENDICTSIGSACNSGISKPSHVLTSIGLTPNEAKSSLRITLDYNNTKEEVDEFVDKLKNIVHILRMINKNN